MEPPGGRLMASGASSVAPPALLRLLPLAAVEPLIEHFPGRTLADLYAYISVHQWVKKDAELKFGIGINELVPQDMQNFRRKMSNLKKTEYPDMLQEITAFVLMNVAAKREIRIVDKLFNLSEVKEVHSVHGSIDIIAKIVLKRNLTSSDAETIGDFVRDKVRLIPGISAPRRSSRGTLDIKAIIIHKPFLNRESNKIAPFRITFQLMFRHKRTHGIKPCRSFLNNLDNNAKG